jgi:hypothetical protein
MGSAQQSHPLQEIVPFKRKTLLSNRAHHRLGLARISHQARDLRPRLFLKMRQNVHEKFGFKDLQSDSSGLPW